MDLRIKAIKKIEAEIVFRDLATINYIVGKNGSGKSSLLNALMVLKGKSLREGCFYVEKDSFVSMENNSEVICKAMVNSNGREVELVIGDKDEINIYANKTSFTEDSTYENSEDETNIPPGDVFIDMMTPSIFLGGENEKVETLVKKYFPDFDIYEKKDGDSKYGKKKALTELNGKEIKPRELATGIKKVINTENFLDWIDVDLERQKNGPKKVGPLLNVFIFDEIENTLHPSLAKKLVSTIQSSVKKLKDKFSEDIFIVFIITHSPFVVSSVLSNLDQKIYLIDDGKFKNIIMDPRSKRLVFKDTLEEESLGFSGPESVFIASSMLGFEASDVGYPENFILTEENSLCELLNVLKDKEIIKNIGFISARGNGNVEKRAEVFQKICSDEVILKCNPFYAEKYGVIVDEFESKEVSNGGLNKIKEKIGNERFIELNRQSLEDYYELFNESLFNEYKSESSGKKSDELGKIKGNYAKKIAEKVNSTEDFKRLFKDEEELWELLLK